MIRRNTAKQTSGLLSPWLRKRRMEMARKYIKGRVLDYGCGAGEFAAYCNPDLYLGIDIDTESIKLARAMYPRYHFEPALNEHQLFDTIVSLAVIEHVSDPVDLLSKFRSILRPDGLIILTTPHPSMELVHSIGSKLGIFSSHANEEHKDLINLNNMQVLMNNAGLTVLDYKRFFFRANQLFVASMTEFDKMPTD